MHHEKEFSKRAFLSKEERELQEKRAEFLFIQEKSITKAKREGLEQGFEKGIEKGIEQGIEKGIERGRREGEYKKAIETARRLHQIGLSLEEISDAINLSLDEIKKTLFK